MNYKTKGVRKHPWGILLLCFIFLCSSLPVFAEEIGADGATVSTEATAPTDTVPAKPAITLNKSVYVIKKGKTYTLKATINKSAYKKKKITWSSSKKSVATVSSKGKVTGKKKGTATITAKIKGTSYKASCKITVGYPVTSISLGRSSITRQVGESYKISATVKPSNASIKKVKYTSSNKEVATVSSKGVVTTVGPGEAKITIASTDGLNKKATLKVNVIVVEPYTVSPKVAILFSYLDKYSSFLKENAAFTTKVSNSPLKTFKAAEKALADGKKDLAEQIKRKEEQDQRRAETSINNTDTEENTSTNEPTEEEEPDIVITQPKTIKIDCVTPFSWAIKEMGLVPDSFGMHGTKSGFASAANKETMRNYGYFIKEEAVGKTTQYASDHGLIIPGDVLSMTFGDGGMHTAVYYGRDDNGNAMVYDGGSDAQKLGYAKVGCGPISYANAKYYTITEIFRFY